METASRRGAGGARPHGRSAPRFRGGARASVNAFIWFAHACPAAGAAAGAAASGAADVCTCSTWRGPITASTARLAMALPVPNVMPEGWERGRGTRASAKDARATAGDAGNGVT